MASPALLYPTRNGAAPTLVPTAAVTDYPFMPSGGIGGSVVGFGTLAARPATGRMIGDVYVESTTPALCVWSGVVWISTPLGGTGFAGNITAGDFASRPVGPAAVPTVYIQTDAPFTDYWDGADWFNFPQGSGPACNFAPGLTPAGDLAGGSQVTATYGPRVIEKPAAPNTSTMLEDDVTAATAFDVVLRARPEYMGESPAYGGIYLRGNSAACITFGPVAHPTPASAGMHGNRWNDLAAGGYASALVGGRWESSAMWPKWYRLVYSGAGGQYDVYTSIDGDAWEGPYVIDGTWLGGGEALHFGTFLYSNTAYPVRLITDHYGDFADLIVVPVV